MAERTALAALSVFGGNFTKKEKTPCITGNFLFYRKKVSKNQIKR